MTTQRTAVLLLCIHELSLILQSDLAVDGQVPGLHSGSAVNKACPAVPRNIQRSCSMMPWLLHSCFLPSSDTSEPMVTRRGRTCQLGTEVCVWLAKLSKLKRLPWYVTAISHQQMADQKRQIPSDAKWCRGLMIYGPIPCILKSPCLAIIPCFLDWWCSCRGWPGWDTLWQLLIFTSSCSVLARRHR